MTFAPSFLKCRGCDYSVPIQHRPIVLRYVFPDGTFADGGRTFAWCASCARPTNAERQLDAVAIEAEIAVWNARRSWASRVFPWLFRGDPTERAFRENLQNMLKLARTRVAPPRCLDCGETEIRELHAITDAHDLRHVCGQRMFLVAADQDGPRFSFKRETILLDGAGRRIRDM